ncbi:unnamed protein product, partial [marine sediment metagenome]
INTLFLDFLENHQHLFPQQKQLIGLGNQNTHIFSEFKIVNPVDVPDEWLEGSDQYQTDDYDYGLVITTYYLGAQEFKPTKEKLTAVALYLSNLYAPSDIDITISIRKTLDGDNLTSKTLNADEHKIKKSGRWVMFDFDDITITPEESYYIVCSASGGLIFHSYTWFCDIENKYSRGKAWAKDGSGDWYDLEDPGWDPEMIGIDLCFITYFQEPPKSKLSDNYTPWLFSLFQWLIKGTPYLS